MAYDWQTKVALQATYEVTKLLRKKYPAEYRELLDKYKKPKTNYVSKARSALRRNHEAEFQELYSIEVAKHGVTSLYQRRVNNLDKIKKLLENADPTKPFNVRTY